MDLPSAVCSLTCATSLRNRRSQPQSGSHGLGAGQIAGIVIGVLLAVLLAALLGFLALRRRSGGSSMPNQGSSKSTGGMSNPLPSLKAAANSLKIGGSSKFERFNDGLEMSESTRRMEGFGSSPGR